MLEPGVHGRVYFAPVPPAEAKEPVKASVPVPVATTAEVKLVVPTEKPLIDAVDVCDRCNVMSDRIALLIRSGAEFVISKIRTVHIMQNTFNGNAIDNTVRSW